MEPPIYIDSAVGSGVQKTVTVSTGPRAGHQTHMTSLTSFHPLNTLAQLYPLSTLGLSGDVFFVGNGPKDTSVNIGVEVKSLGDLISSIQSNRLQEQLKTMMGCGYHYIYLLYYGVYRASKTPYRGVHKSYYTIEVPKGLQIKHSNPEQVWRLLPSYQRDKGNRQSPLVYSFVERAITEIAQTGIRVIHVPDKRHAALYIGEVLYSWWQKPWGAHTLFSNFNTSSDIPPSSSSLLPDVHPKVYARAIVVNKLLKGVGWNKAISAAKHFQGMWHLLNCHDVAIWGGINGWGKVLAGRMVGVLMDGYDGGGMDGEMEKISKRIEELKTRIRK